MDYKLTIQQRADHMHIVATGRNSREAVAEYMLRAFQQCVAKNCPRVLIEARLIGTHLPLWDIFEIAAQHSRLDMGFLEAVAYVDINDPPELAEFIENVTRNRGLPLRVFRSVATAEKWLAASIEEDSRLAHSAG